MRSLGQEKRVRKEPNGELDRFSKLMFGANRRIEGNKKDESSSHEIRDRGFMFGAHQHREGHERDESSGQEIRDRKFLFGGHGRREGHEKDENSAQVISDRKLMFGGHQHREEHTKNESSSQVIPDQEEAPHSNPKTNQFDHWLFGTRRREEEYSTPTPQNQLEQQIENLLTKVDVGLLMETIDMLVETTKQYKPLLKEIPPMFNQFIKKFKSK